MQHQLKKADILPVQVNIRIYRLGPLGPWEVVGNRKVISQNGIKNGTGGGIKIKV